MISWNLIEYPKIFCLYYQVFKSKKAASQKQLLALTRNNSSTATERLFANSEEVKNLNLALF